MFRRIIETYFIDIHTKAHRNWKRKISKNSYQTESGKDKCRKRI